MKTPIYLAVLMAASFVPMRAGNVILNPGFETGDFTSWTVTEASDGSHLRVEGPGNTGSNAAFFGATTPGLFDTIAQSFDTVNGQSYTFSFFLSGSSEGGGGEEEAARFTANTVAAVDPIGDFQAFWNGQLVLDSASHVTGDFDFTQFSFNEVATGHDTISFSGYNVPSFYTLDDVSVNSATAAPEPATWALLAAGLAAGFVSRFRSARQRNRRCAANECDSDTPARR